MVKQSIIDARLTKLGVKRTFFSRPEIRELQHILMDHEQIVVCVQGRYSGGFAILVATDLRLLLVDKKPLYLTVEDIRYDMISEVDINSSLVDATITVFTVNKQLVFSSTRKKQLRELTRYVQRRVMELRQYHPEPTVAEPILTHDLSVHMPHLPRHVPQHLSQAVGGAATRLASRIHNPNPYTKAPLIVRRQWTNLFD